jgi:DNA-binding MarR family transcriptional regulator
MDGSADLLQLDSFLPYRAARLATALSRGLAAQYEARYQISVPEWRVLVHLTQETEISVRDIFTRVDMDRARVTRAVQRLEARGLVSKLVNESDRRLVRLALTPAGRDLAVELSRHAMAFESRITAKLPAGSVATLLGLFDSIEGRIDDEIVTKLDAS